MAFKITTHTLATAVADAGTITVAYPTGTAQADFTGRNAAADGVVVLGQNSVFEEADGDVAITYGATNITITNSTGVSWPAGSDLLIQLGMAGLNSPAIEKGPYIFEQGPAIADVPTVSATYTQSEVNAIVSGVNTVLAELRALGLIAK